MKRKIGIEQSAYYMQGFVAAKQASGMDWARLRVAVEDARKQHIDICEEYEKRIQRLEQQIADLEHEIIRRDSEIEALKLAWRHRGEVE